MANVENKFRIIVADYATMRNQFPLSRQREIIDQAGSAVFFMEAAGENVSEDDIRIQINEWNKGNIIAIMIHGFISQELNKSDEENSRIFGVPIKRVATETGKPIETETIL